MNSMRRLLTLFVGFGVAMGCVAACSETVSCCAETVSSCTGTSSCWFDSSSTCIGCGTNGAPTILVNSLGTNVSSLATQENFASATIEDYKPTNKNGVITFKALNIVSATYWNSTVPVSGTISETTAEGVTSIDLTYTDIESCTKTNVKWSGRITNEFLSEFQYNGHRYQFTFDASQPRMHVVVDSNTVCEKYFICGLSLATSTSTQTATTSAIWSKSQKLQGLVWSGAAGETVSGISDSSKIYGTCEVKCGKSNKNGIASVSVTVTPIVGKKLTYRSQKINVTEGTNVVSWTGFTLKIVGSSFYGRDTERNLNFCTAKVGGKLSGAAQFCFGDVPDTVGDFQVAYPKANYMEPFTMANARWTFARAAAMKWQKCSMPDVCGLGSWVVDTTGDRTNITGLKLTYAYGKGTFKGTFKVYTYADSGRSYKASVKGLMADGVGYGIVTVQKTAQQWNVSVTTD